jgi:hypothetical protein
MRSGRSEGEGKRVEGRVEVLRYSPILNEYFQYGEVNYPNIAFQGNLNTAIETPDTYRGIPIPERNSTAFLIAAAITSGGR